MLRNSLWSFGGLLSEQPTLAQRIVTAARGTSRCGRLAWRRTLSSLPGAVERRMVLAQQSTVLAKVGKLPFTLRVAPRRTFHASQARRSESQSLSARLKKLSREYGWAAVGVYLALSALDFPLCFVLVRTMGTERIAAAEHAVVGYVQSVVPESWRRKKTEPEPVVVKEAEPEHKREASLATQLALAYAIHKSVFIFVRVPLTALITPKIVKVLRSWGWKIGRTSK